MNQEKNKKMILLLVGGAIALLAIVGVVVLSLKNERYRMLKVETYKGSVLLVRDASEETVFAGMHLKSGDVMNIGEGSNTLLLADDDKHLLAEENTSFSIETVGNKEKGSITINLQYGSTLITIDNKLNEESSFEVYTPNATLSVRGTIFRVTYDKTMMCTIIEILDGTVEITSATGTIMGGAGETYYVDTQGMIQVGTPYEEMEDSGEDIGEESENGLLGPITITQAVFESDYIEETIELTPENSEEYFEVVEKDGSYYFTLKPGYTVYGDEFNVETNYSEYSTSGLGGSRYLFSMEDINDVQSWTASGTIVKYTIPDDMWCKVDDMYMIFVETPDGVIYSIER